MRALVTGATGKVGYAIASALLDRGDQVRALVRDPEARGEHPPGRHRAGPRATSPTPTSLAAARRGLRAGLQLDGDARAVGQGRGDLRPGQRRWAAAQVAARREAGRRPALRPHLHPRRLPRRHRRALRRDDARRLPEGHGVRALQAARRGAGARRARRDGGRDPQPLRRLRPDALADALVRERGLRAGGAGSGCRPSRPAAPATPSSRASPPATCSPPRRAKDGERYILADGYADFRELAETAKRIAGRGRVPPRMPVPVAKAVAVGRRRALAGDPPPAAAAARASSPTSSGRPARTPRRRSASWAGRPTPLEEGVRETLDVDGPARNG